MKNLKNKIINLILALVISTLVFTGVESTASMFPTPESQSVTQTDTVSSTVPVAQKLPKTTVQKQEKQKPVRDNFQAIIMKFLIAMGGVLVSAVILFLVLKTYKKFFMQNGANFMEKDYANTLESPKNFKEAINIFLSKTNK